MCALIILSVTRKTHKSISLKCEIKETVLFDNVIYLDD